MGIGNRPLRDEPFGDQKREMPLIYQGMIDAMAEAGGEVKFEMNGDITSQIHTHTGAARMAGTHHDWLRCVAWGMVEGSDDGTMLRLTPLGRSQTRKVGTP